MTDYRRFVQSRLAELDRRRKEIEAERQRLTTTLSVMDEADTAGRSPVGVQAGKPDITSAPAKILNLLNEAEGPVLADDIYRQLGDVARPLLHSALHRLKKRGTVFKDGKRWCLAGRDDASQHEALTAPTEERVVDPVGQPG